MPRVNSTTRRRTPPPGASRRTLGRNPEYRAPKPSSRAMRASEGNVQLYLGVAPATCEMSRQFERWGGHESTELALTEF